MRRRQRRYPVRNNEPTMRDLQKALASGRNDRLSYEMRESAKAIADLNHIPLRLRYRFSEDDISVVHPIVDRLVGKYGPKALLSDIIAQQQQEKNDAPQTNGEERKKDTDEVHEATSMTSNDTHGGDGASGEVPDGHSTNGDLDSRQVDDQPQSSEDVESKGGSGGSSELENMQRGQGTADPRINDAEAEGPQVDAREPGGNVTSEVERGPQKAQGPSSSKDSTHASQEKQESESGEDTQSDEGQQISANAVPAASSDDAEMSTDRTSVNADKPAMANEVGEDEGNSSENKPSQIDAKKAARKLAKLASQPSQQAKNAHGGITAELRKAQIAPSIVSQARTVLASWTADGGQDEQSMRWDYSRLAARLLTKRSPYPARKEELGRPVLLVLADVSGSCASFSGQALLVSKAIAAQGMPGCDVLIVAHSNGYPEECELNGRPLPQAQHQRYKHIADRAGASYRSDGVAGNVAFYQAMIADYSITHVIALGDHDAVDVYTMLAEHGSVQQVIWLDNYACNCHEPRIDKPEVTSVAARAKIRYLTGCKDASAFLAGLRVAIGQ